VGQVAPGGNQSFSNMNHTTLTLLVDEHTPMLRALAHQLVRDEAATEDLVQATFLALAGLAVPPNHPKAWLWQTLRRIGAESHRQRFRREKREMRVAQSEACHPDPLEGLCRSEDSACLQAALGTISCEDRELLVAVLWGNLTFVEAAKVLGGSSSSLHRRYHQILNKLRQEIMEKNHASK
jgi:RNA polymerase sigma factor (sigma-70 family)